MHMHTHVSTHMHMVLDTDMDELRTLDVVLGSRGSVSHLLAILCILFVVRRRLRS